MFVGIAIAIVFDIFRVLRRIFKTADIITYIEDIVFWAITAFILLYAIFVFNNGQIRFYLFIAIILGSLTYLLTLSKYFVKINVKILTILLAPFRKIFAFLARILRKIAKKIPPKAKVKLKPPKMKHFLKKITEKRRILAKDVEEDN